MRVAKQYGRAMSFLMANLAIMFAVEATAAEEQLICCGQAEVFVLAVGEKLEQPSTKLWTWKAEDSAEIPAELRAAFRTTDECKPYGERLLITSSSGGVALLRRANKSCLFYTRVKNAHSACLLPNEQVAVASSFGGDELLIFGLNQSGAEIAPVARMKLLGAHGTVWDAELKRLWALGSEELLLVKLTESDENFTLQVEQRYPLPTDGGHDLSPARDSQHLFVTTEHGVYQFDKQDRKFAPFEPLQNLPDVKSLDEHPRSGRIVYHQADIEQRTWWSDRLRFLDPAVSWQLPREKLYKIRWDVER